MNKMVTFPAIRILAAVALLSCGMNAVAAAKPNILVIMADDVGWASLGSYHQGVKSIETPNLDKLASQGVRLTDYYAQPSCTAGRAAFMTGQLPVRSGMHTVGLPGEKKGLHEDDPTLPGLLKRLGYTTGQFGKNHLGDLNQVLPTNRGFDECWGWLYHLNAMEYTVDPDWPSDRAFNAKYGPRNIIHSYATDTDKGLVDERWGPLGKQRITDDGPAPPERQRAGRRSDRPHAGFHEPCGQKGKTLLYLDGADACSCVDLSETGIRAATGQWQGLAGRHHERAG